MKEKTLHQIGMVIWGIQIVAVAILMWPWDWKAYLVEISLYANFASNWAGRSAEKTGGDSD